MHEIQILTAADKTATTTIEPNSTSTRTFLRTREKQQSVSRGEAVWVGDTAEVQETIPVLLAREKEICLSSLPSLQDLEQPCVQARPSLQIKDSHQIEEGNHLLANFQQEAAQAPSDVEGCLRGLSFLFMAP